MALPTNGQIDFAQIYNEFYESLPSGQVDMKMLNNLFQNPGMSADASISYFYDFDAVQTRLWRYQNPYNAQYQYTADSCTAEDNNMLSGGKYNFTMLIDPSMGGYTGGTFDVSVYADASTSFAASNSYSHSFIITCSSNGGVSYPITLASISYSDNTLHIGNAAGSANIQNINPVGLKFRISQSISPPTGNWTCDVINFNVSITGIHMDGGKTTARLLSNAFHGGVGNAFETYYVSGVYDYLNWNLTF